jgi:hypothetical protein
VEVVFGGVCKHDGQRRVLRFGSESRVMTIELWPAGDLSRWNAQTESDSFVHLSENVLRRFRCQFE